MQQQHDVCKINLQDTNRHTDCSVFIRIVIYNNLNYYTLHIYMYYNNVRHTDCSVFIRIVVYNNLNYYTLHIYMYYKTIQMVVSPLNGSCLPR
jgi:hypothetical protein